MPPIRQTQLWEFLNASLLQWIGLFVAIVVLAGVIVRIRTWIREDADAAADHYELLTGISDLHREGDLSEEEYRSIKGRLVSRLGERPPAQE